MSLLPWTLTQLSKSSWVFSSAILGLNGNFVSSVGWTQDSRLRSLGRYLGSGPCGVSSSSWLGLAIVLVLVLVLVLILVLALVLIRSGTCRDRYRVYSSVGFVGFVQRFYIVCE